MSAGPSLSDMGFSPGFYSRLVKYEACRLEQFSLTDTYESGGDVLSLQVFFGGKKGAVKPLYYEARFRKSISLAGEALTGLDNRMSALDWARFFYEDFTELEEFKTLLLQMDELEAVNSEGLAWLKVKHWAGTQLGDMMKVAALCARFETSQRFYFLPDGSGIGVEEAFRFLHNRWIEKEDRRKKEAPLQKTKPSKKKK